jgi:hypothetical protein
VVFWTSRRGMERKNGKALATAGPVYSGQQKSESLKKPCACGDSRVGKEFRTS